MPRKLLRVTAPHFVAGAEFCNTNGRWECDFAAPILHWMIGKSPAEIHDYLGRKGWHWEWLNLW